MPSLATQCEHLAPADTYHSDCEKPYARSRRESDHAGDGGTVDRHEWEPSVLPDRLHRLRRRTESHTWSVSRPAASVAMICARSGWG